MNFHDAFDRPDVRRTTRRALLSPSLAVVILLSQVAGNVLGWLGQWLLGRRH